MVLIYKKRVYPIVVACLASPKYHKYIYVSVVNFHLHCEVPSLESSKPTYQEHKDCVQSSTLH